MWGWIVFALGLVFLISGVLMAIIGSPDNQTTRNSAGQPVSGYTPAYGTASVALISIGSIMVTGGLVAEIVAATMRPSSAFGARRK